MKGSEVKEMILSEKIKLWIIADRLGITDSTFSRKLRHEWNAAQVDEVKKIIQTIKAE